MSDLAIDTTGLRKIYGAKVAVADLTLQVPQGEVFGFLGPNGAGKSTSVKMLLGLVKPSGGTARVLGQPAGDRVTMARVGFLPEHFRYHEWLQAAELLDVHGRLYGMDRAARKRRIPELLELVGLQEHALRPISGFSKGMLQRIGLAQALLNEPQLVFLDEPTSALDPFGRMLVRGIIRDLKARGTTVFLNSHLLGEVEATCDRVSFIKAGRVLQTMTLRGLDDKQVQVEVRLDGVTPELLAELERLGTDGHHLRIAEQVSERSQRRLSVPDLELDLQRDTERETATAVMGDMTTLELVVDDEDLLPAIAACIVDHGARLYALKPRKLSLEQLFLDIVGTEDSGQ